MNDKWFCEAKIVKAVDAYLREEGWGIEGTANTATREPGPDIYARKDNSVLIVEAKGYPSQVYQRGEKVGQPKPTDPSTQARHWYGEVLLSAILRQGEYPRATVAIALPEYRTYTNLVRKTRRALGRLGIIVYIVKESGRIEVI